MSCVANDVGRRSTVAGILASVRYARMDPTEPPTKAPVPRTPEVASASAMLQRPPVTTTATTAPRNAKMRICWISIFVCYTDSVL